MRSFVMSVYVIAVFTLINLLKSGLLKSYSTIDMFRNCHFLQCVCTKLLFVGLMFLCIDSAAMYLLFVSLAQIKSGSC